MPIPSRLTLKKADLPFWRAILRSRDEWTELDLVVAAQLARCQRGVRAKLRIQGDQLLTLRERQRLQCFNVFGKIGGCAHAKNLQQCPTAYNQFRDYAAISGR